MSTANKALIHRWFEEVWNKKRKAAIAEMLHPDANIHGLPGVAGNQKGPQIFTPFWQKFVEAFPDLTVARCSVRGRHTGLGLGIPPTNRPVNFIGVCIARVEEGKLIEGWNIFDFLTFYQQIGLVPSFATS